MNGYDDDDNAAGSTPPPASASPTDSGSSAAFSLVTGAARAGWEAENRAAAQRLVAAHQLMSECMEHPDCSLDPDRPGYTMVDPQVMACSHLVRMLPISAYKAEAMLSFAADLHFRYPAILEAMGQGRMDQAAAFVLAAQMGYVADSALPRVQQEVVDDYLATVESGERPGVKAVAERVDEIISSHDPDGVRQRKADSGRDRGARISKGRDGMAMLYALLHSDEAAVLAEALDEKVAADRAAEQDASAARAAAVDGVGRTDDGTVDDRAVGDGTVDNGTVKNGTVDDAAGPSHDDAYSLGQRRADALMSLVCGEGTGGGEGTGRGVTLRPKVTVIAPGGGTGGGTASDTASGADGGAGGGWADRVRVEFARTGEGALQALLDMLASGDGATIAQIDPALGAADDAAAALRYRPSAALAQRVRLRDGTCRHPGCNVPAEGCDLDHVLPFNHADPARGGPTTEANLADMCRKHHRFKTFNDWDYRLEPDGTLIITTPEGKVMVTRPNGPLAAYRREHARAEAQAWERQQRRNPDPGRAAAAGGADSDDYVAESSWARREARRRARREQRRAQNAANRERTRGRDTRFCPVTVAVSPGAINIPAHRASRWWHANQHRYQPDGTPPGVSLIEDRLRVALGLVSPRDCRPDPDDPPPF